MIVTTTDQIVAARVRAKRRIKELEKLAAARTVQECEELKAWRALKRKLDKEIAKRIVQLPLL